MADFSGETLLWLIVALLAVALIGWLLLRGSSKASTTAIADAEAPPAVVAPDAIPVAAPAEAAGNLNAIGIAAPDGPPDDLRRIKGIGPKLVALLGTLEISRYDQIAAWSEDDIVKVDAHLGTFKGRITRDNWVEQAKLLADGRVAEFEGKFGKLDPNAA